MTKQKIEKINQEFDIVYRMMVTSGYDQNKLNLAFLQFNLMPFDSEKEAFNIIVSKLNIMNEKVENYEACAYLQKIKKQINRTRKLNK